MRGLVDGLRSPHPLGGTLPPIYLEDSLTQRITAGLDEVLAPVLNVLDNLDAYLDPALAPSDFYEWLTALADPKHEGHALRAAEDLSTHSRSMKGSKLWQLWQKRPRRRSRLSTDLREAASVSSADQDGGRRRAVTDQLISVFD